MAAASLIATAFGIILLILTAYFLAGGALLTIETVSSAQKDMTDLQSKALGTAIEIDLANSTLSSPMYLSVKNSGNEPIKDLSKVDVYIFDAGAAPTLIRYSLSGKPDTWKMEGLFPDLVYPGQWDPGERLNMTIFYSGSFSGIQVTTGNGISARTVVP